MNLHHFASVMKAEADFNIKEAETNNYYASQPLTEVTKARYYEMLECLPPTLWVGITNGERFCMSEHQSGSWTSSFAKYKGKYYHKYVDITNPETFITPELIESTFQ